MASKHGQEPARIPTQPESSYIKRCDDHPERTGQRLLQFSENKKSNMFLSSDHNNASDLLEFAEQYGPHIVCLRTSVQLICDLTLETLRTLQDLAGKHHFLIWEDHDYHDTTSNASQLYESGVLPVAGFADFITYIPPGEERPPRAICSWTYRPRSDDCFCGEGLNHSITCTEGVSINLAESHEGYELTTPVAAIESGYDFIVCGREILPHDDPLEALDQYRKEGWAAHEHKTGVLENQRTYPEVDLKAAALTRPENGLSPAGASEIRFCSSIEMR